MAQLNFDATTVAPDTGFETVPAGWYNVKIDESEMKPTKDGAGNYLQIRFDILDGQYHGRKLFTRLNLKNSNQQTVEIAMRQLSAIAHAVGVLHVQDSSQLHGIPLKVKVKIRKDKTGEYEDQNDITSYKNINEQVDMAGGNEGPAQGGFAPPAAGGFAPPAASAPPAGFPGMAPAAPPAGAPHDPLAVAASDGWVQHPQSPAHMYKGQDVKTVDEVKAMYPAPAPAAAPAAPAVPPAAPAQPWAGGGAQQPWAGAPAAPAPAPSAPPAAPAPSAPAAPAAPAAVGAPVTPPWANPPAQG